MTMAGNVPLNNQLEKLDARAGRDRHLARWVSSWTAFNHVRTAAALAAAGALTVALSG